MSLERKRRRDAARDANIPPANRIPQPIGGRFRVVRCVGVGSWCPTPDGSGPAEAVVMHFETDDGEFGLRLRTPQAVDEVIAMLERHRNDVWPGA